MQKQGKQMQIFSNSETYRDAGQKRHPMQIVGSSQQFKNWRDDGLKSPLIPECLCQAFHVLDPSLANRENRVAKELG
jgi:hypothetical protein